MDDLLHNDDLLIRYLDGELKGEEKAALELRLKTDKALSDQLTKLQVAVQAVRQLGTTQNVNAIHAEMMQELKQPARKNTVVPMRKMVRYAMAVAASIFILFIGVRVYTNAQLSPGKLYNQAFVDFSVSETRGGSNTVTEIEKFYKQKNYSAVITSTRSMHLDAKDSLLIGLSYLHTNQAEKAISFLHGLTLSKNDFKQDAEFYLSLGFLKIKTYDKALPLMQKITADPSHLYHKQFDSDFIEDVRKLNDK